MHSVENLQFNFVHSEIDIWSVFIIEMKMIKKLFTLKWRLPEVMVVLIEVEMIKKLNVSFCVTK